MPRTVNLGFYQELQLCLMEVMLRRLNHDLDAVQRQTHLWAGWLARPNFLRQAYNSTTETTDRLSSACKLELTTLAATSGSSNSLNTFCASMQLLKGTRGWRKYMFLHSCFVSHVAHLL